ncbi:hypothetical protein PHMEG_0009393 [Phytophthora megakarya]|uniref:Uncharacterized protein n=1 Tax=Phytophthora megakarya TaxID=4795 RepID=A0A225WGM4_9STRA|nr:hypothetical protein PHMEG_0009393 [Phytophthora megakarya]
MSDLPVKRKKKRYFFLPRDDLLMLETVLNERDFFCLGRARRVAAWDVITDTLNRQGVLATNHTLRCRLARLVREFQEKLIQGKDPDEFTPLEQLLDQYSQAEAHFEESRLASRQKHSQEPNAQYRRLSVEGRRNSSDSETEDEFRGTGSRVQSVSARLDSSPENQIRKKRFYFKEKHDVILLKAALNDEGITKPSGTKKPAWKRIQAAVNSQGVDVKAHSIRTRLRLMVRTHRREESTWDMDQFELSERQKLLRAYCKKLDEEIQIYGYDEQSFETEDQSVDPTTEEQSFEATDDDLVAYDDNNDDRHTALNSPQNVELSAESSERTQNDVPTELPGSFLSADEEDIVIVPSTSISRTQEDVTSSSDTPAASLIFSAAQNAFIIQGRGEITNPVRASDTSTMSINPAQGGSYTEDGENIEPASKRQKLGVETILERFITDQNERQKEQQEHDRTRSSEQQELQRQTIDLQQRSLDIQEKAMQMQERLMALMEKVMDKLG